jgi:hypothetical protein
MLHKLKAQITAATANVTKGMLRCVWQEGTVGGMYAELQVVLIVKCFTSNNFSTCVLKNPKVNE